MALDHLVEKINLDAAERRASLQKEMEERMSAMDDALKHRLQEFERNQSEEFTFLKAENERAIELASRNRKKLDLARLKGEMIAEVYDAVEKRLDDLRSGNEFPEVLNGYLREALEEYRAERDDEPVVYTHPANIPLLDSAVMSALTAHEDDSIESGVEVQSEDGELRITNTLQSRFEQGKGDFLKMFDALWKETFFHEQP